MTKTRTESRAFANTRRAALPVVPFVMPKNEIITIKVLHDSINPFVARDVVQFGIPLLQLAFVGTTGPVTNIFGTTIAFGLE